MDEAKKAAIQNIVDMEIKKFTDSYETTSARLTFIRRANEDNVKSQ